MQTGRSAGPVRCGPVRSGHRLAVSGEIDQANAAALGVALEDGVTVLDLTGVTFFGVAGVRVPLEIGAVAAGRGHVVRVSCSSPVRRVLEVCDLPAVAGLELDGPRP
ncbi:STAS domain-containing protein [Cryptosporangium arvum]|uniref:STAS domain-containing protein n=1 Tax=Cryptosporangium arvum TaxID=80871 RepID=UPI0004B1B83F|nr:STAS domain-containing protein [Cryptosporangium arvum]